MKYHTLRIFISLFLLPVGMILMLAFLSTGCNHTSGAQAEGEVPVVTVAYPQVDSILLTQSYPATLQAGSSTDVVARVNGTIRKVLFTDGQYVKAGQPLYTIESNVYADQVQEAAAALETATAQRDYASNQLVALKKALEAEAVSKMDVIQAESNLRQSEAAIREARARLQSARTLLGYCTVTAPISGRISQTEYRAGAYVGGEAQPVPLTKIYNDEQMYVMFSVDTDRYMEISGATGTKKVNFDHVPVIFGDTITATRYGRLDYEAPAVNTGTGSVTLRLIIDNPDGTLRSGMFCNVDLPYADDPKAILVTDASISTDQLGKFLYVVNDSDKVVYTPIQVGQLYHDTLRVVTSGLRPADRYVTTALLKVREGMSVKPVLKK